MKMLQIKVSPLKTSVHTFMSNTRHYIVSRPLVIPKKKPCDCKSIMEMSLEEINNLLTDKK